MLTLTLGLIALYLGGAGIWWAIHEHQARTTPGAGGRMAATARDATHLYPIILTLSLFFWVKARIKKG